LYAEPSSRFSPDTDGDGLMQSDYTGHKPEYH
jgi:hypothetical protein